MRSCSLRCWMRRRPTRGQEKNAPFIWRLVRYLQGTKDFEVARLELHVRHRLRRHGLVEGNKAITQPKYELRDLRKRRRIATHALYGGRSSRSAPRPALGGA